MHVVALTSLWINRYLWVMNDTIFYYVLAEGLGALWWCKHTKHNDGWDYAVCEYFGPGSVWKLCYSSMLLILAFINIFLHCIGNCTSSFNMFFSMLRVWLYINYVYSALFAGNLRLYVVPEIRLDHLDICRVWISELNPKTLF